MDESTELRKLSALHRGELSRILEDYETWKTLMAIIPKTLRNETYVCKIDRHNLPKYHSEHFRLIENASKKTSKSCSEILFEEWGCSGRVRPTLGHLLFLLTESHLFRAADYVATILGKEPPERPLQGPPAIVKMTSSEMRKVEEDIESILDSKNYLSSVIEEIQRNANRHVNNPIRVIPQIVISETPEEDTSIPFNYPIPVVNNTVINTCSDMIKFSESTITNDTNIPAISMLLQNDSNLSQEILNTTESNIPRLSELISNSLTESSNTLPNLSLLKGSSFSSSSEQDYFPNFDALNSSKSVSIKSNPSVMIPTLINDESTTNGFSNTFSTGTKSRSCSSPLPNLSLNTHLPHFSYCELEAATNSFDETPHEISVQDEPLPTTGRFLGSGAFGSVFLALGILDRPVAVKKINLKDLNIVSADNFITKQFKNEVEILCKYKHDNLLSLVGYSCDGLTYCLLYEYIPGGNLKDRLEKTKEELFWTQRLHIAMGTARGVSYLHTAYSTPLIHRDIKSANILLDATNKPKLCDFGIVRLSSTTTTGTSQIFGTSAYMPPEAHRGDVSVKMDTFSFGVVLLELLTGLPPIDYSRLGNDLVTHVQDSLINEDDITPLLDTTAGPWSSKNVNFANELYKISTKCLQEKKNLRPTMIDVTKELSGLIQMS